MQQELTWELNINTHKHTHKKGLGGRKDIGREKNREDTFPKLAKRICSLLWTRDCDGKMQLYRVG